MNLLKKAGLAVAMGAVALASAAPASAQRYYHHYHGGDRGAGIAIAGLAGLAIGAAIASDHDRYRGDYYYDRPHYYPRGYYEYRGYYPAPYRPYYPACFTERRWDPYYDQPVYVRVCR